MPICHSDEHQALYTAMDQMRALYVQIKSGYLTIDQQIDVAADLITMQMVMEGLHDALSSNLNRDIRAERKDHAILKEAQSAVNFVLEAGYHEAQRAKRAAAKAARSSS